MTSLRLSKSLVTDATSSNEDKKKKIIKSQGAQPVITGDVTCVRYLKLVQMLSFGAKDGFFSVVQVTPEDVAKKCNTKRVETFRMKGESSVLDI
jgi:hypothetical protein